MEEVRLNKYLSEAGVCSRREADRLIEAGKVTVDGNPAVTGMRIRREQEVAVDGKAVESREERILLAVYKPPRGGQHGRSAGTAEHCGFCGISRPGLSGGKAG